MNDTSKKSRVRGSKVGVSVQQAMRRGGEKVKTKPLAYEMRAHDNVPDKTWRGAGDALNDLAALW